MSGGEAKSAVCVVAVGNRSSQRVPVLVFLS
jgi:hypothetical protein